MMSDKEPETGWSKTWFQWRIVWSIIRNLVYVVVLLLAYDKMQSSFEIIALSALILTCQTVNWSNTTGVRMDVEEALVQRIEKEMRRLVKTHLALKAPLAS
jgi:hypothetical protein